MCLVTCYLVRCFDVPPAAAATDPLLMLLLLLQVGVSSIPPAVVSMLAVPLLLSVVSASTADRVVGFYDACIAPWTTDLLGLFYVPAVAILPVLLCGMQGRWEWEAVFFLFSGGLSGAERGGVREGRMLCEGH